MIVWLFKKQVLCYLRLGKKEIQNMKLFSFLLSLILIAVACSSERMVEVKDDDGNLLERYQVNKDGTRTGIYESYNEGKIVSKANYKEGIQSGKRVIFFENGNLEIEENYKEGALEGPYSVYYDSGELMLESQYINNAIQGQVKKYYKSGQLMENVAFIDSEENGPFVEYWENGNLKWEGSYLNGDNEYGELKKYNEEGVVIRKLMCDSSAVCRTFWTLEDGSSNEE